MVSNGAKQAIWQAVLATVAPGDEVRQAVQSSRRFWSRCCLVGKTLNSIEPQLVAAIQCFISKHFNAATGIQPILMGGSWSAIASISNGQEMECVRSSHMSCGRVSTSLAIANGNVT